MDNTYKGEQVLKKVLKKQATIKENALRAVRWSRDSLIHELEERGEMWALDDIPTDEEVGRRETAIASILEEYRVMGLVLDEEVSEGREGGRRAEGGAHPIR